MLPFIDYPQTIRQVDPRAKGTSRSLWREKILSNFTGEQVTTYTHLKLVLEIRTRHENDPQIRFLIKLLPECLIGLKETVQLGIRKNSMVHNASLYF